MNAATAQGSRVYTYLISVVAATAGLLFGFDIAVINGALIFLRQEFHLTEVQTEMAASSLLAGCILGAAVGGYLSDRFGRRKVLMVSAVLFALSAVGAALPHDLGQFAAARLVGGVGIGMASLLAPLYIAEVSPPLIRGRLVSLNQMAIVTGVLLAYVANWGLSFQGSSSWRWMFAAAVLPSLAFLIALFFVPESPRWLTEAGREAEALQVLTRVSGDAVARAQLVEIRGTIAEESGSLRDLFRPRARKVLLIGIALAVLQQVTGINTVLFYGSIILKEQVGGASESGVIGANVIIGLVNFIATIAALWVIDRVGRRPLLLLSAGVMFVAQMAMAACFQMHPPPAVAVVASMLVCVAAFAVGLGPGVWVLLAEIFPTRIRGRAMSIATVSLWVACLVLTSTFLTLVSTIGISGAFLLYGILCLATLILVSRAVPETKGRSLEQIEAAYYSGKSVDSL